MLTGKGSLPERLLKASKILPKEIERVVDSLAIVPEDNLALLSDENVNVAALQVFLRRYATLGDYVFDMNLYVADAVNRRAHLVCFPDYSGMLPLSFLSPYDAVLAALQPEDDEALPPPGALFEVLSRYADALFDVFSHTMSLLAARHRIFLMAGTVPCFDGGNLFHRALLFDDKGVLAGCQDKLSLSPYEQEAGFSSADELKAFDTPAGTVAILAGTDADYFELGHIAKKLGAQILLGPRAFLTEITPVQAALGLNMRVQETSLYGVQSTLAGDTGLGFALEGAARLLAPNELMRRKNGILAAAQSVQEPEVVCRQINLQQLSAIKNPYTQDKNSDLWRNHQDCFY